MRGLDASIKKIQSAGFSYIKVELEAQLWRDARIETGEDCGTCGGKGYTEKRVLGIDIPSECSGCNGETRSNSTHYNFNSEPDCQRYLQDNISEESYRKINFFKFYRDGSVDSELTFTLPIIEAPIILEVIAAWNKFAAIANTSKKRMEVEGAGMHVCVLTSSSYPSNVRLPADKMQNFISEVTKLMPALFIAGTSGNFTRGLRYRQPRVSTDKYSAIATHNGTCLEYRVFETCYQRPEAMYEYIGVIARTLEYYIDPTKKVSALGKSFPIYEGRGIKGFTGLPEQVDILKKQFKHLQPEGMTVKQFMSDRGIVLSTTKAKNVHIDRIRKLKIAYKEHLKAYEKERNRELSEYELDAIEFYKRETPGKDDTFYWELITGKKRIEEQDQYIKANIATERPTVSVAV